jgi:hypothetical protein
MNGLIIIIGESFRLGGQGTRIRGIPESYDKQIEACNTHILFLNNLKNNFNCNTSVYISTYDTKYNNDLLNIYKDYLVGHKIYEDTIGLTQLFKNSINDNINIINTFDFIFYFRIDLFLKDYFIEIFNPNWNVIKFPTICWKKDSIYNNKPRVNDMMLFIPKNFFDYLNKISICHEAWYIFSKELNINDTNLDVMINTYHDSDSSKDFNPLYYIVNRPETNIWHSDNELFINKIIETFSILNHKYKKYKILKYNKLLYLYIFLSFLYLLYINLKIK